MLALLALLGLLGAMVPPASLAARPLPIADAQSRTGPTPPPEVLQRDLAKAPPRAVDALSATTLPVPAYEWRHGCGPTALGMVIGYYDGQGYAELIPGSAASQTHEVDQAIASGGDASSPFAPGSERHYEDYASPQDYAPEMLPDAYLSAGRPAHASDSIADFMFTSRSDHWNYYGWSWASHVGPAFVEFVSLRGASYTPTYQLLYMGQGLNWSVLTGEIDAGRPMVFLVDTGGDGATDHFVAVIGYRTSPALQYASLDTWGEEVRWEDFRAMASGTPWGVAMGWALHLAPLPEHTLDVTIQGAGSVHREPDEPTYTYGTVVTLTATPAPGWRFGRWSGAASGSDNPLSLAMTADLSLTAHFYDPAALHVHRHMPIAMRPR